MNPIIGYNNAFTRFGHGNSGRHKNLLISDWKEEFRRLRRVVPNDPRVKGKSLEQFLADKQAALGRKDTRK